MPYRCWAAWADVPRRVPIFCQDMPTPGALITESMTYCSLRARVTTARWRRYSSPESRRSDLDRSLRSAGEFVGVVEDVLGLNGAWWSPDELRPGGHGVDDLAAESRGVQHHPFWTHFTTSARARFAGIRRCRLRLVGHILVTENSAQGKIGQHRATPNRGKYAI